MRLTLAKSVDRMRSVAKPLDRLLLHNYANKNRDMTHFAACNEKPQHQLLAGVGQGGLKVEHPLTSVDALWSWDVLGVQHGPTCFFPHGLAFSPVTAGST